MNREEKINFIKDLKVGKVTIEDITLPGQVTEFWKHDEGYYINKETGARYSDQEFKTRPRPKARKVRTVVFEDFS